MSSKTYPVTAEQLKTLQELAGQFEGLAEILKESDKFDHILNVLEPISHGLTNTLNRMPYPGYEDAEGDDDEPESDDTKADEPEEAESDSDDSDEPGESEPKRRSGRDRSIKVMTEAWKDGPMSLIQEIANQSICIESIACDEKSAALMREMSTILEEIVDDPALPQGLREKLKEKDFRLDEMAGEFFNHVAGLMFNTLVGFWLQVAFPGLKGGAE